MNKIDLKHLDKYTVTSSKSVNLRWEQASAFATYCDLNVVFVMSLFKKFGQDKVLNSKSFIKDCRSNKIKAIIWYLTKQ